MKKTGEDAAFDTSIYHKFTMYNSLFLNLPFQEIAGVGALIPLLTHDCRKGLESGSSPQQILEDFFRTQPVLSSKKKQMDFMFQVVQYVERQIVLYDSVEDAAFEEMISHGNHVSLRDWLRPSGRNPYPPALFEKLADFSVRIVFTAHPTQFYPRPVLDIIARLRGFIAKNNIREVDRCLAQLGRTSLMNSRKPTPFDEAKNIIYFLRSVYYDGIGELYAAIKTQAPDQVFDNHGLIQLGFWPGGDRDGNPYVTSDTTLQVADELRMTLMKCYYNELKGLELKLTFKGIDTLVADLRARLYESIFDPGAGIPLPELLAPLEQVRTQLIEQFNSLYLEDLDAFLDKVRIFKTHFAALDIRQHHDEHRKAVEAVLKAEKRIRTRLDELSDQELIHILIHEDVSVRPEDFEEELVADTLRTMARIRTVQEKNGPDGCHRYIISNAEDGFSVLFVFALLRWSAFRDGPVPLDIIPLFESMAAMEKAESIMASLFKIPRYMAHLKERGMRQTIMLGFSDGTKDGGFFTANWSIFKTKEALSRICRKYGIKAVFFDGRGGPPARGGGKSHRFYAAQTHEIANEAIQLTIQGQTITSLYGTRAHFIHNCEQLLTAGLGHALSETPITISKRARRVMETLARVSHDTYTALKTHEMFIPYLENKSTLKHYAMANIGSRPAKRGKEKKLTLEDLRAISFVGAWSQLKQNVPGYFGMGTALKAVADTLGLNELQALYKTVPFFRALVLNSMMSMSKSYFKLTAHMARDREYGPFWALLHDEYRLTREMVLKVSDTQTLMEEEAVTRRSIKIREEIVLPLLVIQQYAFGQREKAPGESDLWDTLIQRTLYGNINASRNSA